MIVDYLKVVKRLSREQEIAEHGKPVYNRPIYVETKKLYRRKRLFQVNLED